MLLVVGGAYSGKRQWVRKHLAHRIWISAYERQDVNRWKERWNQGNSLVLEGWERWLEEDIIQGKSVEDIRHHYQEVLYTLKETETFRQQTNPDCQVVLVMLEMGRGVVPIEKQKRLLRDTAGWLLQDAAVLSNQVVYLWHGLAQKLK